MSMPASPPTATPALVAQLRETARALSIGLFWGGGMLIILALWLAARDPEAARTVPWIIGGLGLASMALGWVPALTLWQQRSDEEQVQRLTTLRRTLSLLLLCGGVLLVGLAITVGMVRKSDTTLGFALALGEFGQAAGLLLLALACLGIGWQLQRPLGSDATPIFEFLRRWIRALAFVLLALGICCLIDFGFLAYNTTNAQSGTDRIPELVALLALTILLLGSTIWLSIAARRMDLAAIRTFVLYVGGLTGLIVFCLALGLAWSWRQDIWGGMSAWQGENAWHLWLVIYIQLFALALIFGSLGLARTDVRSNPSLRRMLFGYNDLFLTLLVLQLLIVLNIVIYALVPFSFQWTESRGLYDLSPATKNLLGRLKKETHVIVLMPSGTSTTQELRSLLDNAQAETNQLRVEYISPDRDMVEYQRLAQLFPKILPDLKSGRPERGILMVYGAMPTDAKHAVKYTFIPENKLVAEPPPDQRGEKPRRLFFGEGEILRELNFLVQNQVKRKIYVMQGAGTPDVSDKSDRAIRRDLTQGFGQLGLGVLADLLRKENFEVVGLSFEPELPGRKVDNTVFVAETGPEKKKDVPEDAHTLIVAGVSQTLPTDTVEAVTRYLDRGGKALVFLDMIVTSDYGALVNTGLEPLLKRHAVEVRPEIPLRLLHPNDLRHDDPTILIAWGAVTGANPLAAIFREEEFQLIRSSRIFNVATEGNRFKAEPVLQLLDKKAYGRAYLLDNAPSTLRDPAAWELDQFKSGKIKGTLQQEPLAVALAVSEREGDKPRLFVMGDTDMITNLPLTRFPATYAVVLSALEWMGEREPLGLRPKETGSYTLNPGADPVRLALLPGWLMLVTLAGVGTVIWLIRRR